MFPVLRIFTLQLISHDGPSAVSAGLDYQNIKVVNAVRALQKAIFTAFSGWARFKIILNPLVGVLGLPRGFQVVVDVSVDPALAYLYLATTGRWKRPGVSAKVRWRLTGQFVVISTRTKRRVGLAMESVTVTRSKLASMEVTLSVAETFTAHEARLSENFTE